MLVYPSGIDVSSSALRFLAARLREHRRALGSRWRRLNAGRQALLTVAHLRNGQPYAQLAAGFGIGTTTAYRYITEAVNLLAALAPTLTEAVRAASMKAYVILDGTLLPIDRIAVDRPFYSGKHKKHGMNVQVIADPKGRLMWASPALADAVHDVRAAREHSIIEALAEASITCWADKACQAQAARSVSLTAADGTASPPASRPSTGPTQRSAHWSSRPSPPSSPGASSANSVARRPGSRASSKPSWSSISLPRAESSSHQVRQFGLGRPSPQTNVEGVILIAKHQVKVHGYQPAEDDRQPDRVFRPDVHVQAGTVLVQIRLTWAAPRLELPYEAAHFAAVHRVDLDLRSPGTDRVCQRTPIDAPSARITLDHRQERHSQGLPDVRDTATVGCRQKLEWAH